MNQGVPSRALRSLPLVLLFAGLLALEPSFGAAAPPPTFEQWASREVRRTGHPGMALAVVVGDTVVFARGYGTKNKWRADPVTPDTVFRIASITKVLSGLALLELRDAGALSLDDTLASR